MAGEPDVAEFRVNILFVCPYTPTPIRTRPYNLLRALARRGHSVTLATVWETPDERRALAEWREAGLQVIAAPLTKGRSLLNMLRTLPTPKPLQAMYCWHPELWAQIRERLAATRLDVCHVEHLRGSEYAVRLKQLGAPVVWDSVDCITMLFERARRTSRSLFGRWIPRLELARTRRYEGRLVRMFRRVLATSAEDAAALQQLARDGVAGGGPAEAAFGSAVDVLSNGVDLDYFRSRGETRAAETVVFTGKMSYHANTTAALSLVEDIMPMVWHSRPDARVEIVGNSPPRELAALASRLAPRVIVTGYVDHVPPYLCAATVAVAPMAYGAGVQNKILEAMACATPVVATPQATAALEVRAGSDLLVADSNSGMAGEILRLLADAALRHKVGLNGRSYVVEHHNWDRIATRLEGIYQDYVDAAH